MTITETAESQAASPPVKRSKSPRKAKIPRFIRPESWRYNRLKENWKKPKGLDNKTRLSRKGYPTFPKIGYRGSKQSRGLHPSGFVEILVHKPGDLGKVDPSLQAVRIGGVVGRKKKIEILEEAKRLGVRVLNPFPAAKAEEEAKGASESE